MLRPGIGTLHISESAGVRDGLLLRYKPTASGISDGHIQRFTLTRDRSLGFSNVMFAGSGLQSTNLLHFFPHFITLLALNIFLVKSTKKVESKFDDFITFHTSTNMCFLLSRIE